MIPFREVTIDDIEWIRECNRESGIIGSEYSAGTLFLWSCSYNIKIANVGGMCCILNDFDVNKRYVYPFGNGDKKAVIEALIEDAKDRGIRFALYGVSSSSKDELEELFPGRFEFGDRREDWDYIYSVDKLTNLAGRKLHGKRNHIARFKDNENWQFEIISEENFEECLAMNKKWCELYEKDKSDSINSEKCAVSKAFENYRRLGLEGGLLRLDGNVIAYTLGEKLTDEVFLVHFEKAFGDIQGAYPMINQQFVSNCLQDYKYVNREEDMGNEGLRKAKLSYDPDILLEKFVAFLV
ncbi:MAG: DUF2156 domain-containing protein [Lachnospiraceae bacterium]|nr:DUF2156 domain-containing protein [Lachnospiraceae bacterium]